LSFDGHELTDACVSAFTKLFESSVTNVTAVTAAGAAVTLDDLPPDSRIFKFLSRVSRADDAKTRLEKMKVYFSIFYYYFFGGGSDP
jgi:hypothetical protein